MSREIDRSAGGEDVEHLAAPGPCSVRVHKSDVAVITKVDPEISQFLGWDAGEMVGKTSLEFIHPDDQALAVESWMQMLASPDSPNSVRLRHRHRDGSWVTVEIVNRNLLDDANYNCVLAEMTKLSSGNRLSELSAEDGRFGRTTPVVQPLRLHEAIRGREQLVHRLAEALPLGIMLVDAQGRVIYTNQKLHTILEAPRKTTAVEQLSMVVPEDRELVAQAFDAVLESGLDNDIEIRLATSHDQEAKDRHQCTISLRALTAGTGEITGSIACVADVTESIRMRDELRMRATFDQITQCRNRASTMEALETILASSLNDRPPAVIFIDLDRFKEVNDHYGHAAGDELLAIVAKRLLGSVRSDSIVGRIGGDEFLVICPGVGTPAKALRIAGRVSECLHHPVTLKMARVSCDASIGVALCDEPQIDADTLIARADAAMYEAKRQNARQPVLWARHRSRGSSGREADSRGSSNCPF